MPTKYPEINNLSISDVRASHGGGPMIRLETRPQGARFTGKSLWEGPTLWTEHTTESGRVLLQAIRSGQESWWEVRDEKSGLQMWTM